MRTDDTDIHAAIARSRSHDEIVTIRVRNREQARELLEQLTAAVGDDEASDYADANGIIEVWAYGVETEDDVLQSNDDMLWRVHLDYSA